MKKIIALGLVGLCILLPACTQTQTVTTSSTTCLDRPDILGPNYEYVSNIEKYTALLAANDLPKGFLSYADLSVFGDFFSYTCKSRTNPDILDDSVYYGDFSHSRYALVDSHNLDLTIEVQLDPEKWIYPNIRNRMSSNRDLYAPGNLFSWIGDGEEHYFEINDMIYCYPSKMDQLGSIVWYTESGAEITLISFYMPPVDTANLADQLMNLYTVEAAIAAFPECLRPIPLDQVKQP